MRKCDSVTVYLVHHRFTVSASKWQVEFFKEQPSQVRSTSTHPIKMSVCMSMHVHMQVKEFIKRAKAWRNLMWEIEYSGEYSGKPKSYLISVLVLRAYEIAYKITLGDTSTKRIAMQ